MRERAYNRTRRVFSHRRDCSTCAQVERGEIASPWSPYPERTFFGTRAANEHATRGRWHVWIEFRCNDPQCPALLLVDGKYLVDTADLNA